MARVVRVSAAVAAALLFLWLLGPAWRGGFPAEFPDTYSYLDAASAGPFSTAFWAGVRPPAYPMVLWLTGSNGNVVAVVQVLAWCVAWGWLLSTAWRRIDHRAIRIVAVAVLALTAVEQRWLVWLPIMLTEALSGALLVAGVAAWWNWWAEPSRYRLFVAGAVTAVWMLMRDANAYSMLAAAVPVLLVAWLWAAKRPSVRANAVVTLMAVVLAVGGSAVVSQSLGGRGSETFHNNVGLRWLADDGMREFFDARGMPTDDALMARGGGDAWADGEAFLTAADLEDYRDWARGRGRVAFAESMVLRPDWYLERLHDELPFYVGDDHQAYNYLNVGTPLPDRPLGGLGPSGSRTAMYLWALASAGLLAANAVWRSWRAVGLVLLLAVPVLTGLYLGFAADAVEVGRHLVGPLLGVAVVSIVAVATLADELARRPPETVSDG